MKRILLYTVLLSLLSSVTVYAVGLGDITVHSYLNEPFEAEIELIDVGNTPLAGVRATLASFEDFERVGLERTYATNLLVFKVEKTVSGKPVIKVRSQERITDPYLQLLVDLAWNKGQVYRSYTVLLDPPDYQLRKRLKHPVNYGTPASSTVIHEPMASPDEGRPSLAHGEVSYGPTMANETIWQIAQRYKTPDVLLQQIILAIVGTNPDAFAEGNLNGLQVSTQLTIPSSATISKIPVDLAKLEVFAHDSAWQSKQPIRHILLPPYIDTKAGAQGSENQGTPLGYAITISKLPAVPLFAPANGEPLLPKLSTFLSAGQDSASTSQEKIVQQQAKAEIDIATTAIVSVRETNILLTEQLRLLQSHNQRLEKQLQQREQDIKQLQKQILQITQRQGMAGQTTAAIPAPEPNSLWPWLLIVGLMTGGAGFLYWFWQRPQLEKEAPIALHEAPMVTPLVAEQTPIIEPVVPEGPVIVSEEPVVIPEPEEPADVATPVEFNHELEPPAESQDEHLLEFEPGLPPIEAITPVTDAKMQEHDENNIDFIPAAIEPASVAELPKPSKSKRALDTLLDLAKTYISMGDTEAAKQSLQEVIDHGSDEQKLAAHQLLDQLQA